MPNFSDNKERTIMQLQYAESLVETGCDEAGRGCLAGPVVAAAVVLPKNFKNDVLNDSKQLSPGKREQLRLVIEKQAIAWAVAFVAASEIDRINILQASFLAMHKAIAKLDAQVEHLAIDGNRFKPYNGIPHTCLIKGDGRFLNIAAASVLAKTYRDREMLRLHQYYPQYGWNNNQGYPTAKHRKAIAQIGISPLHRKSFRLLPEEQLSLNV